MIEIKEEKGTTRAGQITELLHRSFAEHQCRGLVFAAAVQNEAITCQRMQSGTCLVAEKDNRLVGTVIVSFLSLRFRIIGLIGMLGISKCRLRRLGNLL